MADTSQAVAYLTLSVAASTTISSGDHVCYDGSGDIVPASDTSGLVYAGQAGSDADNSAGIAGAITVKVVPPGVSRYHIFACSSAAKTWQRQIVSFVNLTTVALAGTNTNDIAAGRCIRFIDATHVLVDTADRSQAPVAA